MFERFFRVNKSHSKKIGGTGLGLAVVKHIAQYHYAKVNVGSREDEGTRITVVFHCETQKDMDRR
ncbi:MAG: ATP-binding protein [Bacillota bacterium]